MFLCPFNLVKLFILWVFFFIIVINSMTSHRQRLQPSYSIDPGLPSQYNSATHSYENEGRIYGVCATVAAVRIVLGVRTNDRSYVREHRHFEVGISSTQLDVSHSSKVDTRSKATPCEPNSIRPAKFKRHSSFSLVL
jgi:hypothetical protein